MLAERLLSERKGLYRRTVSRAADLAGGYKSLARRLGVSRAELQSWMNGEQMPPVSAFLVCVELLGSNRRTL